MEVAVKAVGTKPLLLHNVDLANPLNPYARRMAELRGTRSSDRTDKWFEEMSYNNFMGAFYDAAVTDDDGQPVTCIPIPAENMRRSLVEAAKTKRGESTKVLRATSVPVPAVSLIFEGPKDPQKLWDTGKFHLTRMMRSRSGASPSTYPMFRVWAVSVSFELDETVLNLRDFTAIVERAGRIEGLGACRKLGYGRYDGLVQKPGKPNA